MSKRFVRLFIALNTAVALVLLLRRQLLEAITPQARPETWNKTFVYLLQTESCLPDYFLDQSRLGSPRTCSCDVIVLSYKHACTSARYTSLSHVSHITNNDTSWASGRNVLLYAALQSNRDYHYYIFLDDDVKLDFSASVSKEMKLLSPFRVFEQWLVDFEPAVGAPHYLDNEGKTGPLRYRKAHGCATVDDVSRTVLSTVNFDALFNAFHRKAILHLLPYNENQDFDCWWTSQRYVSASAEIKFRGQSVLYLQVEVKNPGHRPYPRGCLNEKEINMTRQHLIALRDETPSRFRNHSIFRLFIKRPLDYIHDAETFCFNPKAKMNITPYRHFLEKSRTWVHF